MIKTKGRIQPQLAMQFKPILKTYAVHNMETESTSMGFTLETLVWTWMIWELWTLKLAVCLSLPTKATIHLNEKCWAFNCTSGRILWEHVCEGAETRCQKEMLGKASRLTHRWQLFSSPLVNKGNWPGGGSHVYAFKEMCITEAKSVSLAPCQRKQHSDLVMCFSCVS